MLGLVRSAFTASAKPVGRVSRVQNTRVAPRKLTQVAQRKHFSSRVADAPLPGSKAAWKIFAKEYNGKPRENEDYSPERILTLNDLEYNREAATVNGRLRHLVNIGASYDEARHVAQEAVDAGIELDMQSFIYLSTLYKTQIQQDWESLRQHSEDQVAEFAATFVPDASALVAFLKEVHGSADQAILDTVVRIIRERKPKLDVETLQALELAHGKVGANGSAIISQLHKEYLIDTPTFDTFARLQKAI